MVAPVIEQRCCCCFALLTPCYMLGDQRCEDCSASAWHFYDVRGAIPMATRIGATPARLNPPMDAETKQYLSDFYRKN
jgi:hypothetical protein